MIWGVSATTPTSSFYSSTVHPFVYPNLPASSVEWELYGELLAKKSLEFGVRCKVGHRILQNGRLVRALAQECFTVRFSSSLAIYFRDLVSAAPLIACGGNLETRSELLFSPPFLRSRERKVS